MATETLMLSIAAGFVSLAAIIVSLMQLVNANRKLKLDLYARRVQIHTDLLEYVNALGNAKDSAALGLARKNYNLAYSTSLFLFAFNINELIRRLGDVALFIEACEKKMLEGKTLSAVEQVERTDALLQLPDLMSDVTIAMHPYLNFTAIQSYSIWR